MIVQQPALWTHWEGVDGAISGLIELVPTSAGFESPFPSPYTYVLAKRRKSDDTG